jgi:hypothetical protein
MSKESRNKGMASPMLRMGKIPKFLYSLEKKNIRIRNSQRGIKEAAWNNPSGF